MPVNSDIKEELSTYLKQKMEGSVEKATVVSAYKLSSVETDQIKKGFPEIKKLVVKNKIDPKIISGFIIRYGSYVIDLSLAGKLNSFRKLFYEIT